MRIPEPALKIEFRGDQPKRLDPADQNGDNGGDDGDGEIVIELADRLDEGPAIGAEHQDAVGRVDQRHAGGEQCRKGQDRPDRQALGRLRRGDGQQADLGRRVEAQTEEKPDRQHLPALVDQSGKAAERSGRSIRDC